MELRDRAGLRADGTSGLRPCHGGRAGLGEVLSFVVNAVGSSRGVSTEEWQYLIHMFKRSLWPLGGEWVEGQEEWRWGHQVCSRPGEGVAMMMDRSR